MKVVTKFHEEIPCKFIAFDNDKIIITQWDNSIREEQISDIDYISLS